MSYGFRVWDAQNRQVAGMDTSPGGFYLGTLTVPVGSSGTFNYPVAPGSLRVYQAGVGRHSWAISGNSVVVTASAGTRTWDTHLRVFSTEPIEADYGLNLRNSAGELIASTSFGLPYYVGDIPLDAGSVVRTTTDGYQLMSWNSTVLPGGGSNRMVFWVLPDDSRDIWYEGSGFLLPGHMGASITAWVGPGLSPTGLAAPRGIVFSLDAHAAVPNSWGLQVFNASQQLTFDGSLRHWRLASFGTGLAYPDGLVQMISPGLPASAGLFLHPYVCEKQVARNYKELVGTIRRVGGTVQGTALRSYAAIEDASTTATYIYGNSSDLLCPVIDASVF